MKWQYKKERASTATAVEIKANECDAEGWEVVSVFADENPKDGYYILFRRKLD